MLYYDPPTDEIFEEVKEKATQIWKTYSDEFGYQTEKINRIKNLKNVGDNVMYMIGMFHTNIQKALAENLSKEARKAIADRYTAGGGEDIYNIFKE